MFRMPSMSCATYHQNCRFNGSTTFKLMSYERSRRMVESREETGESGEEKTTVGRTRRKDGG